MPIHHNVKDAVFEAWDRVGPGGGRVFRVREGVRRAKNEVDMESVPAWETTHPTRNKTRSEEDGLESQIMDSGYSRWTRHGA